MADISGVNNNNAVQTGAATVRCTASEESSKSKDDKQVAASTTGWVEPRTTPAFLREVTAVVRPQNSVSLRQLYTLVNDRKIVNHHDIKFLNWLNVSGLTEAPGAPSIAEQFEDMELRARAVLSDSAPPKSAVIHAQEPLRINYFTKADVGATLAEHFDLMPVRGDGNCAFYSFLVALLHLASASEEARKKVAEGCRQVVELAREKIVVAQATTLEEQALRQRLGVAILRHITKHLEGIEPVQTLISHLSNQDDDVVALGQALRDLLSVDGTREHLKKSGVEGYANDSDLKELARLFNNVELRIYRRENLLRELPEDNVIGEGVHLLHSTLHFNALLPKRPRLLLAEK